jgi:hypothetical protein
MWNPLQSSSPAMQRQAIIDSVDGKTTTWTLLSHISDRSILWDLHELIIADNIPVLWFVLLLLQYLNEDSTLKTDILDSKNPGQTHTINPREVLFKWASKKNTRLGNAISLVNWIHKSPEAFDKILPLSNLLHWIPPIRKVSDNVSNIL